MVSHLLSQASLSGNPPTSPKPQPTPYLVPDPPAVERWEREDLRLLRQSLETTIGSRLTSGTELIRALAKARRVEQIPTTLSSLDALLGGGLPRGKMVEIAGRAARFSIVLAALAAATTMGEAAAFIDLGDHLDPQVAAEIGVDLERLLWIRPQTLKQAVMSAEMIEATGFQLVVLDAGLSPLRGRRVPDASWVRLARTAEAHGAALLVSTPYPLTGTASEVVISTRKGKAHWVGVGKQPRLLAGIESALRLEKHRRIRPGSEAKLVLQLEDVIEEEGAQVWGAPAASWLLRRLSAAGKGRADV